MFFTFISTTASTTQTLSFETIAEAFLKARQAKDSSTFYRHEDGESLELLLDEVFVFHFQARPAGAPALNQIITALIVYLEGGNYDKILLQDAEELYVKQRAEDDLLPELIEGWHELERARIDAFARRISRGPGRTEISALNRARLFVQEQSFFN